MTDEPMEIRVRPRWVRARMGTALCAILDAFTLVGFRLGAEPDFTTGRTPAADLAKVRACASANDMHAAFYCAPPAQSAVILGPVPTARGAEHVAGSSARAALAAWQGRGDAPSYRELVREYKGLLIDSVGGVWEHDEQLLPDGAVLAENLGPLSRRYAAQRLPAAEARATGVRGWVNLAVWGGSAVVSLGALILWGLAPFFAAALLLYGDMSAWVATRPHRVRLTKRTLSVGPPAATRRWNLGGLAKVELDGDRLVIYEIGGRTNRTARFRATAAVADLAAEANRAIEKLPADARVRVDNAQDGIRLSQRPPKWAVIGAIGCVLLAVAGTVATTGAAAMSYQYAQVRAKNPAHDPSQSAAANCAGGARHPRCVEATPQILRDVPTPGMLEAWRRQELTRLSLQGRLGPPDPRFEASAPDMRLGEPQADAWLSELVAEARSTPGNRYMDVIETPGTSEATQRASAQAKQLRGLWAEAWSDPAIEAVWDHANVRDEQLATGVGWLYLLDTLPAPIVLLLFLFAFAAVPLGWVWSRKVVVEAKATGVHLNGRHLPYANIQSVAIEGHRLVFSTRAGKRHTTGRLANPARGEPLANAVTARILDDDAHAAELLERDRAHAALAPARARLE